ISAELIAQNALRLSGVCFDGEDVLWLEGRPLEQGRNAIVRYNMGRREDVLPPPYNARSRVHEYGGGSYVVHNGHIWFVNDVDQQVWSVTGEMIEKLTDQPNCRFADLVYDAHHQCLYAIREDHRHQDREPVNELVRIDADSGHVAVLTSGNDFYAAPTISPDGEQLAWLSWSHPDMPWDKTTLSLAQVTSSGELRNTRNIVDQPSQAVFQPSWSPDGKLYFVNDPSGWWQLHRLDESDGVSNLECICDYPGEMGLPLWQFGMQTYAFVNENRIVAMLCEQGLWRLVTVCTNTGEVEPVQTPWNQFTGFGVNDSQVVLIAAGADRADEVAKLDIESGQLQVLCQSFDSPVTNDWYSIGESITFETSDNDVAHGFFYPPTNPNATAEQGALPPLLVVSHGGPTGATSAGLNLKIQFWTSRGFAVLDVNYRGSTGYGRKYREKLKGKWGVYDVDDVSAGAKYLVQQGLVNPQQLAIRGSSAGGFTTLAALTFTDTFNAGASFYGISELESLVLDTHKFEARYLDSLVGIYPDERTTYAERSPLYHADQISCPVIFLQGKEDKVVPPEQAQKMASALEANGMGVQLMLFDDEQHGFRRAETIRQALEAELDFYQSIFAQNGGLSADTSSQSDY
ncbi:MAG: S9 family peptidase, partial [Gammaproteobacteria bacterium]